VPGQEDGASVQQHQEPLRRHGHQPRRPEVVVGDRRRTCKHSQLAMAVAAGKAPAETPPGGPAPKPSPGAVALDWVKKFLALPEGSIIVVTVATIVYFSVDVSRFHTGSNFKNLLPYFCFLAIMAAGEVFVMTLGEIDLSIGALYLFTPFIFWKMTQAGLPLVPSVI